MEETPGKVATIIPTYNRRDLVCDAIDSALLQDYQPHEVIVVDDGSMDGTREMILGKYRQRIRYIYQPNRGQAAAKNRGILETTAKFVATLDSDDRWLPQKLTKQMRLASADDRIGLVYSDKRKMRGSKMIQATDQIHYKFCRGYVLDKLIENNFVVSTSVVGRRKAFIEAGLFDESLRVAEDYDLWLRMARLYKFDYVDEVLVEYRVNDSSISQSIDSYFPYALEILNSFLQKYYKCGYPDSRVVQRAYANRYSSLGDMWLAHGKHLKALRAYLQSLQYEPFKAARYRSVMRSCVPNFMADNVRSMLGRLSARDGLSHE